jgi:hypothetical protein
MIPEERTVAVLCQMPSLAGLKAKNSIVNANQETPIIIVCSTLFDVSMLSDHLLSVSLRNLFTRENMSGFVR